MQEDAGKDSPATQDLLPVQEVRDGIIILPGGVLRAVLIASSLNFALKSEDEQNAIIYAFQDFLNALDFPLEISVSSRRLDIDPYLEDLKRRRDGQQNELLRLQMTEYINFVGELVKGNDIMTKSFFITVPFSFFESRRLSLKDKMLGAVPGKNAKGGTGKKRGGGGKMDEATFEQSRKQLLQRVEQVAVGLRGIGLRVAPLQTQEVLELLYNAYNPKTSRNQRLANVGLLQADESNPADLTQHVQRRNNLWVER